MLIFIYVIICIVVFIFVFLVAMAAEMTGNMKISNPQMLLEFLKSIL